MWHDNLMGKCSSRPAITVSHTMIIDLCRILNRKLVSIKIASDWLMLGNIADLDEPTKHSLHKPLMCANEQVGRWFLMSYVMWSCTSCESFDTSQQMGIWKQTPKTEQNLLLRKFSLSWRSVHCPWLQNMAMLQFQTECFSKDAALFLGQHAATSSICANRNIDKNFNCLLGTWQLKASQQ